MWGAGGGGGGGEVRQNRRAQVKTRESKDVCSIHDLTPTPRVISTVGSTPALKTTGAHC